MRKMSPSLRKQQMQYLSLVLPGMIIFTIGLIIPMFLSFYYSLTSWNGMTVEKPFVGLDNYVKLVSDPYARSAWWFTLRFTIWNTIIQNVAAIFMAVALDSGIKGQKLMRTIFFVPCLISAVVVGFVWLKLYGNVLPALFKLMGLKSSLAMLLGKEETVLMGLLIANNWQWIGYWMLIYLAALQGIPTELYEAAKIDGANAFQSFMRIPIPLLSPTTFYLMLIKIIGTFQVFGPVKLMTQGGPGRATMVIVYEIYREAFQYYKIGYASAQTLVLFVIIMLVTLVQMKLQKKWVYQY